MTFDDLNVHVGHDIECVEYGLDSTVNVAVECITCGCVIIDRDYDKESGNDA